MSERALFPISRGELERRWAAVRKAMDKRGVDVIVAQNASDWLGGYVKWLTDIPATNGYPRTVLFYAVEPMTVIEMGPFDGAAQLDGRDEVHRGVGNLRFTPSFFSIAYTQDYDADLVIDDLRKRGTRNVGLVGLGAMPYALVTKLRNGLPGVTFHDMTDDIDHLKAIKSREEIELIRRTATLQDAVFAKVLALIKPGMRDVDVTAIAQHEGQVLGSEQGIFLGGSSPVGVRSPFVPRHMQGRRLKKDDHLSILIENNGPGGFYTELARTIVLGKASNELIDGFEAVREAQQYTLSLIQPGASCHKIAAAHDAFMAARNLPLELRLYAHGQGYDMVERPLIRRDETMTIEEGMCLAVHPGYETASLFAVICDNYIVGAAGAGDCIHETEKKIFELDA